MKASIRSIAGLRLKATVMADQEQKIAENVLKLAKFPFEITPVELQRLA
jgi:hypothetical protein